MLQLSRLFSDIGGQLGLWIGVSMLTLIEVCACAYMYLISIRNVELTVTIGLRMCESEVIDEPVSRGENCSHSVSYNCRWFSSCWRF